MNGESKPLLPAAGAGAGAGAVPEARMAYESHDAEASK